jgi:outer membrane protein OmpA-like peptidoglycan-associated protein
MQVRRIAVARLDWSDERGKVRGARPRRANSLRAALAAVSCGVIVLLSGCQTPPQAPPAKRIETLRSLGFIESADGWMLNLSVPILFDVNRDELNPETRKAVADLADSLLRVGIRRIRVEGHTDNLGGRGHNMDLSRRRAEAVARELALRGFPDETIVRQAWGFEYPAAPNDTAEGRALNRRVTIVVLPADVAAN